MVSKVKGLKFVIVVIIESEDEGSQWPRACKPLMTNVLCNMLCLNDCIMFKKSFFGLNFNFLRGVIL